MAGKQELDVDIEKAIDDLLEGFTINGEEYDICKKAMVRTISNAKKPLTLDQWITASTSHSKGNKWVHEEEIFKPEIIKEIVIKLVKENIVLKLGRQTFCPYDVVTQMSDMIDDVLIQSADIFSLEEISAIILESPATHAKKVKPFVEEKVMTLAIKELINNGIVALDADFCHQETIEACIIYAEEVVKRLTGSISEFDFFQMVDRVKLTNLPEFEGRKLQALKKAFKNEDLRQVVLVQMRDREMIQSISGRVAPNQKPGKYRILDD